MTSQNFDPWCDSDNETAFCKINVWKNGVGEHFGAIFLDHFTKIWPVWLRILKKKIYYNDLEELKPWFKAKVLSNRVLIYKVTCFLFYFLFCVRIEYSVSMMQKRSLD